MVFVAHNAQSPPTEQALRSPNTPNVPSYDTKSYKRLTSLFFFV